jgi:hypothetical protein
MSAVAPASIPRSQARRVNLHIHLRSAHDQFLMRLLVGGHGTLIFDKKKREMLRADSARGRPDAI